MSTWTRRTTEPRDPDGDTLTWHVPPENQGQAVEVAYARCEGILYRRTTDRARMSAAPAYAERAQRDGDPDPWNGAPRDTDDAPAWSVGDHYAGGHGEDRDLGRIVAIDGDRVTVAWRWSESRTVESLAVLRAQLDRGEIQAWDGHASDDDARCDCAACQAHRAAVEAS